jgi:hypothetical protein
VQTDDREGPQDVTRALHPPTIIEGRALAADTGQPIPNAVIAVRASFGSFGGMLTAGFRADDQGRVQVNPFPGDFFRVSVHPGEAQPYLVLKAEFPWPKGAVRKELDLTLPRGVVIRGNVTEEGTGRPVPGATIQFFPRNRSERIGHGDEAIVASKDDGSYQVIVPPGKGYLLVVGPTLDYVPKQIGSRTIYEDGRPGGWRTYAHAIIAYEVADGEEAHEVAATLRPGQVVRGRVTGPEGEPVTDAAIFTRHQFDPLNLVWLGHHVIHARDSRFVLHGLDSEESTPVYFLDADHQWGTTVELSGKQAGAEVTVRLERCGQARARFVGPDGQPVARLPLWPCFDLLMTPGSHALSP